MKKLAVLLGLSGAFLAAQADMTRTFEGWDMAAGDCESATDSYGACMLFEYGTKKLDFVAASGAGEGNVLKVDFALKGKYASAGVGIVFDAFWEPLDASKLTGVKVTLRSSSDNPDLIYRLTLKNSADEAYEALGSQGLGYMVDQAVTSDGATVTIPVNKFVMPPTWWFTNDDAYAWVGSTKAQTAAGAGKDTAALNAGRRKVLASLTSIQVAVNCDSCVETGWFEVDNMVLLGVTTVDGENWIEGETSASVLPRKAVQGLRTAINGQSLLVGRGESSAATLDLIRLDGSKVASWNISGTRASVALPTGLEKGTYYAVVSSEGKRSSTTVSIVR